MKTVIITALLVLGTAGIYAQPRLTINTLPNPIVSHRMLVCDTTGVEPGVPGIGVVWDFTTLQQRGMDETATRYLNRALLPPQDQDLFPRATVFVVDDTVTSGYRIEAGQWRWEGSSTPRLTAAAAGDPYEVRPVEVVYNEPKSDQFNALLQDAIVPGSITRTGHHDFVYDGYGTLLLPSGAKPNTARTTQSVTTIDSFMFADQDLRYVTTTITTSWFPFNGNTPLLLIESGTSVITDTIGIPLSDTVRFKTVRYAGVGSTTGVDPTETSEITVHPQPASASTLTVSGLPELPTSVHIIDILGTPHPAEIQMIGQGAIHVNIEQLPAGRYTVVIAIGSDDITAVRRSFVRMR